MAKDKKETKIKKERKKDPERKKLKRVIFIVEIVIVLVLAFIIAMLCIPNSKYKLIKSVASCSVGESLIGCFLGTDYLDSDFDAGKIQTNVVLSSEYTNIALFGVDEEQTRTDTIKIVSIKKSTGEIKMVSVNRDTVLEFIVENARGDKQFYYDKANQAYNYGGAECAINMLNVNFDLNIQDYVLVNFEGMSNIVDALGGIDINITKEEKKHINDYLVGLRQATGIESPDVPSEGKVHLNGLQVTAYCRDRFHTFTNEDGEEFYNDYGRVERQNYVLEKLIDKAKNLGTDEVIDVAHALLKSNADGTQFMLTSMTPSEMVDLVPVLLQCSLNTENQYRFTTSSGMTFAPFKNNESGTNQRNLYDVALSCVWLKDLKSNVKGLHKYLFDDPNYNPTNNVNEINKILNTSIGIN